MMKKMTLLLGLFLCICLPITLHAQEDDSRYLIGAVPEVNGKVLFTKEFSIPGMSQEEIYNRMSNWMEERLKNNENNSRIVYTKPEDGKIIGVGEEWIIFSSTALSLDRTQINYQLTVTCESEKCLLEVEKIRFSYREGREKYTAEEWIVDKYALNKTQTKLVRGLAKWRRKSVDFIDNLGVSAADALSAAPAKSLAAEKVEEKKEEKSTIPSGPMVIIPKTQVEVVSTQKVPVSPTPVVSENIMTGYTQVIPKELAPNTIQMGAGKLVITVGTDAFNMTTLTANAGGSLGKISEKSVIFTLLTPDQPYESVEKAETYTVRFYPNNQTEPSVVLECKKVPSQAPLEGQPRMYIGEIKKAWTK